MFHRRTREEAGDASGPQLRFGLVRLEVMNVVRGSTILRLRTRAPSFSIVESVVMKQ